MNNLIIPIDQQIYIPFFDTTNGIYIDKSPYKCWERNTIGYECRCRAGSYFKNNTQFKQHIKSQTHCEFIKNYSKYYKEVDESQNLIKELRINNEKLSRENNRIKKENEQLIIDKDLLIKENYELLKNKSNKINKFNKNKKKIKNMFKKYV